MQSQSTVVPIYPNMSFCQLNVKVQENYKKVNRELEDKTINYDEPNSKVLSCCKLAATLCLAAINQVILKTLKSLPPKEPNFRLQEIYKSLVSLRESSYVVRVSDILNETINCVERVLSILNKIPSYRMDGAFLDRQMHILDELKDHEATDAFLFTTKTLAFKKKFRDDMADKGTEVHLVTLGMMEMLDEIVECLLGGDYTITSTCIEEMDLDILKAIQLIEELKIDHDVLDSSPTIELFQTLKDRYKFLVTYYYNFIKD